MRRTITHLLALLVALLPLAAQSFTHPLEVYVKGGASSVAFQLAGSGQALIDWGDGQQETITLDNFLKDISHNYATPPTTQTTITIEATGVKKFLKPYMDPGSIAGFGKIDTPALEVFNFVDYNGTSHLRASNDGVIDLTLAPNLTEVTLRNAPGIRFGSHPKLKKLLLQVALPSDQKYTPLINASLDLTGLVALEELQLTNQVNVKELNITGLTNLVDFNTNYTPLTSLKGGREMTRSAKLTRLLLRGHSLPLSQLPAKNPAVTYSTFDIQYSRDGYTIPTEKVSGVSIDMNDMLTEYDFNGNLHRGSIKWRLENSWSDLSDEVYSEQNGVFTFNEKLFGDEETATIQAVFEPSYFTLTDLNGSAYLPLRSSKVTLKKSDIPAGGGTTTPTGPYIKFTTNKPVGHKVNMLVYTRGNEPVTTTGLQESITLGGSFLNPYTLTAQEVTMEGKIAELEIEAGTAGITSFDLSNAPELFHLHLPNNPELTAIDLSKATKLKNLRLDGTGITTLDATGLTALEELHVYMTKLSLEAMTALIESLPTVPGAGGKLIVQKEGAANTVEVLKEDVAKAREKNWNVLQIDGTNNTNPYEGINKPTNSEITFKTNKPIGSEIGFIVMTTEGGVTLEGAEGVILPNALDYTYHRTTKEEITIKGEITGLWIKDGTGGITAIDLSKAPLLKKLFIGDNPALLEIDVTHNTALTDLYLPQTGITELDLKEHPDLEVVEIWATKLTPEAAGRTIASLPTSKWTSDLVVQEAKATKNIDIYKEDVAKAKAKKWNVLVSDGVETSLYEGIDKVAPSSNQFTFTTSKAVGDKIKAVITSYSDENMTAEGLEPSTIAVNNYEEVEYTITAQTITIKGDVEHISIPKAGIKTIDLSQLKSVQFLELPENELTTLDVSKNEKLRFLLAGYNMISNVVLPEEKSELMELNLKSNYLKEINLNGYENLEMVNLDWNELTAIDVSTLESLELLYADYNKITSLDLANNPSLSELTVKMNKLKEIDLSNQEGLVFLDVTFNQLTKLDLANKESLRYLFAGLNTKLTDIDFSSSVELEQLNLMGTKLQALDLSKYPKMEKLNVANTLITTLDPSKAEDLEELQFGYTDIETINLSMNKWLKMLSLPGTKITELDLSNQEHLLDLIVYSSPLSPKAMHTLINSLRSLEGEEDDEGNPVDGMLVIQHLGENEELVKSKKSPIKVYEEDVKTANAKHWNIKVFKPSEGTTPASYEDYGKGIPTEADRIALGKWYVTSVDGRAVLQNAPIGSTYSVYSLEGVRLATGKVSGRTEALELVVTPGDRYIITIEGDSQVFLP